LYSIWKKALNFPIKSSAFGEVNIQWHSWPTWQRSLRSNGVYFYKCPCQIDWTPAKPKPSWALEQHTPIQETEKSWQHFPESRAPFSWKDNKGRVWEFTSDVDFWPVRREKKAFPCAAYTCGARGGPFCYFGRKASVATELSKSLLVADSLLLRSRLWAQIDFSCPLIPRLENARRLVQVVDLFVWIFRTRAAGRGRQKGKRKHVCAMFFVWVGQQLQNKYFTHLWTSQNQSQFRWSLCIVLWD